MGFGCGFSENREAERKQAFCDGFGYGTEYGYTGKMPQGEISTTSTFILAGMLYDKLEEAKEKEVESSDNP